MKRLCKISPKEYQENLPEIRKVIGFPKYICMKCLRSAAEKKALCKVKKF